MTCQLTSLLNKEKIMATHRTAMGKSVDMNALRSKNEKTRAVGNVKNLNARGDTIDAHGRVIKPVTTKVTDGYNKTVGNRSAQVTRRPAQKIQPDKPKVTQPKIDLNELTLEEREFEESVEDDLEIEQIKQEELTKAKKK
jgi:hypothetical protein